MNFKFKLYSWHGINQQGKKLHGELSAISRNHLKVKLQQQGIKLANANRKINFNFLRMHPKISPQAFALMFRQLATLINSGVALSHALMILKNGQEKNDLNSILHKIQHDIEVGTSLSHAIEKFPHYFDIFSRHLIHIGEQTGKLDLILLRIADHFEKSIFFKNKLKQILFYPVIVLTLSLMIFLLMLFFIVPQFAELFKHMHDKLPWITLTIISFSEFLRMNLNFIFIFLSVIMGMIYFFKSKIYHFFSSNPLWMKLPFIGDIIKKIFLSRFSYNLFISISSGLPISEALKTIAQNTSPHYFMQKISNLQRAIASGNQLHRAMQIETEFPLLMIQMTKVGEESGNLDLMLKKLAEMYETDTNHFLGKLSQLLEPLIMIVLGVLIGGLVIAMYLPIFKLGNLI